MSTQIPCSRCGEPTHMTGTKLCDECWEKRSHGVFDLESDLAEAVELLRWLAPLLLPERPHEWGAWAVNHDCPFGEDEWRDRRDALLARLAKEAE